MADGGDRVNGGAKSDPVAAYAAPIDHRHLGRYTLGNRALEIEVLQLFAGQAPLTLADIVAAATDKAWHIAAHTLKGSARAVGAWEVARIAEAAERDGPAEPQRSRNIADLEASIARTNSYIASLPAGI